MKRRRLVAIAAVALCLVAGGARAAAQGLRTGFSADPALTADTPAAGHDLDSPRGGRRGVDRPRQRHVVRGRSRRPPSLVRAGRSVQPRIQLERGRRHGPRPCRPRSAGAAQRDGRADLGRGPVPAGRCPARHLAPRPGAVRELRHRCSDSLRRTVPRPPAARSLPAPRPLLAALERAEPVALPVAAVDAVTGRMGCPRARASTEGC